MYIERMLKQCVSCRGKVFIDGIIAGWISFRIGTFRDFSVIVKT